MAELANMGSDANYPSNAGIRMGLASTVNTSLKPVLLQAVQLMVGGTPGTGADYQVQVETLNGNWVDCPDLVLSGNGAAATGVVCGLVEGCSVRLNAVNGTSAGTGANTPRYHLGVTPLHRNSRGDYSG